MLLSAHTMLGPTESIGCNEWEFKTRKTRRQHTNQKSKLSYFVPLLRGGIRASASFHLVFGV